MRLFQQPASDLPFLVKFVRMFLRSPLKGRTRIVNFLARRIKTLQVVPISIKSFPPVYVDLRAGNTYGLLIG